MSYYKSFNESRDIKVGDAIKQTTINAINYYGIENFNFMTLGIRGNRSLVPISEKYSKLIVSLHTKLSCAVSVFGYGANSIHLHMVGAFLKIPADGQIMVTGANSSGTIHDSLPLKTVRSLVKKSKSKAGFGHIFQVEPIKTTAEAVGGYLRKNFLQMDEFRKHTDYFNGAGLSGYRYFQVPKFLKLLPCNFSRHTPSASRYRCAMTRLAGVAGTPNGDLQALEVETGLSFSQLRSVAFEICNSMPGNPKWMREDIFRNALNEAGSIHNQFKFKN